MSNYRVLTALAVRAPLLPAATFARLGKDLDAERWWADAEVEFAVTVASPDLADALNPSAATASAAALAALQRYLIRAATRPTPFGGFAAVGVARWADRTDLEVEAVRRPTRTRPDMEWLSKALTRETVQRVYANTCAFEHAGRIYLTDPGTGGLRSGPDVSVRATPVVRLALALARGSGIALEQLARQIVDERPSATVEKVDRLLDELISQQLLLPAHLPPLIGDPLARLLSVAGSPGSLGLADVAAACRRVDVAPAPTAALGKARALAEVQVDTSLPLSRTGVARLVAEDVRHAVDALFKLHPNPGWSPLAGYRAAFHNRYGDDCRVPLLELLDPRFGLGPPSAHAGHGSGSRDRRADVLRDLAAGAIRDGSHEVVLDDALIERMSNWAVEPDRLPVSVELSVLVAARSRTAIDRGDYLLMVGPNLGAQEAGRGLGRFADLLGADARELLTEVVAAEAAERGDDPVVAELVYRPLRARSANVAVRPLLRDYELPVGVASTVAPDRVVHVDELSVGLEDGRFRVWWDTRDRPLLLTAGHMLNPSAAPPVCRALLDLTSDGTTYLSDFDWGPMTGMPFLPRVRYGRVVLCPAQWQLGRDTSVDAWRAQWKVPRLVYLASGDNRLLLDLDDSSHQEQLREAMDRQSSVTVQEALPGPDDGWLPGPRGDLIAELVVPLVRTKALSPTPIRRTPMLRKDSDVLRTPGSDWLYVALDGPQRTEDELLVGSLGALADGLVESGDADGWFFVRYADPDRQLRLRLHGEPAVLIDKVLPELSGWAAYAIASGTRTRFELRTYEREVARYGGPETTVICESIACDDSAAVRRLLRAGRELDRVELALVSMADFLRSLTNDDLRWAQQFADQTPTAGQRFRETKQHLRSLLQQPWEPITEILARRREALSPLVASLPSGHQETLAASLLHLHANRLGLDHAAEQLTLGLLTRTLRSLAAFGATS
ncbi:lantibiotic dehydratase [Kribbella sp. NPDC026611]|uniref:lantibiotic dehydratase n=1 Tax=Kribbella sp. NPDC026611 TaxID=3154911 RepID=UPI0033E186D5